MPVFLRQISCSRLLARRSFSIYGLMVGLGAVALILLSPLRAANGETLAENLASRSPEINFRVITPLDQLIPDCREVHPDSIQWLQCGNGVFVYFQGPYAIDLTSGPWVADLPFLSWTLANKLRSAARESDYFSLNDHCTAQAIDALKDWVAAQPDLARVDAITVTYLSPSDPWAWCMHTDNHSWDYGLRNGLPSRERSHEFWLWWQGAIVGQLNCGMANSDQDPQSVYPQCNLEFFFARGKYHLVISPFAAANVGSVLSRSPAIAEALLVRFPDVISTLELPLEMLEQPIVITDEVAAAFAEIEAEIK